MRSIVGDAGCAVPLSERAKDGPAASSLRAELSASSCPPSERPAAASLVPGRPQPDLALGGRAWFALLSNLLSSARCVRLNSLLRPPKPKPPSS